MDLVSAARVAYDEVEGFLVSLRQAERARDARIQDSFANYPSEPPLPPKKLFNSQKWKDLVYACEIEREELQKIQLCVQDRAQAADVFKAACLQEQQEQHDREFAQALAEVRDDDWHKTGNWIERPFVPEEPVQDLQPPVHWLIYAGMVKKSGKDAGFAGCGAALVSPCGDIVWRKGSALGKENQIEAEDAGLLLGLRQAHALGLSRVEVCGVSKRRLEQKDRDGKSKSACAILQLSEQFQKCSFIGGTTYGPDKRHAAHLARIHAVRPGGQHAIPEGLRSNSSQDSPGPRQPGLVPGSEASGSGSRRARQPNQGSEASGSGGRRAQQTGWGIEASGTSQHSEQQTGRGSEAPRSVQRYAQQGRGKDCGICLEKIASSKMFRASVCGHEFCRECMRKLVIHQIKDRRLPVICPNCKSPFSITECSSFLDSRKLLDDFNALAAEITIPDKHRFYCPNSQCSALLTKEEAYPNKPLPCPECRCYVCGACEVVWHTGFTCEQFSRHPDRSLYGLARANLWTQCWKCGQMIEKRAGCNHMHCICGADFCYRCGRAWSSVYDAHGALAGSSCGCALFDTDARS